MPDLFDVSMAGAGFHFTSHLIALAALFIACFAIAGYITFRKNSIPGDALKDQNVDFGDIVGGNLNLSGDLTVGGEIYFNDKLATLTSQGPLAPAGFNSGEGRLLDSLVSVIASDFATYTALANSLGRHPEGHKAGDLAPFSRVITGSDLRHAYDSIIIEVTGEDAQIQIPQAKDSGYTVIDFHTSIINGGHVTIELSDPREGDMYILCGLDNITLSNGATFEIVSSLPWDDHSYINHHNKGSALNDIIRWSAVAGETFKIGLCFCYLKSVKNSTTSGRHWQVIVNTRSSKKPVFSNKTIIIS